MVKMVSFTLRIFYNKKLNVHIDMAIQVKSEKKIPAFLQLKKKGSEWGTWVA